MLNPIAPDKRVLRHTLLAHLLETAAANARFRDQQQVFEIGHVYLPVDGEALPDEPRRLGIVMTGRRYQINWTNDAPGDSMDFYDLKGVVDSLLIKLKISNPRYSRANHPTFHPGRSAMLHVGKQEIGVLGELHPQVARAFDLTDAPVLAAEFNLDPLLAQVDYPLFNVTPLPQTPPVYQDIALVVREATPAADVEAVIVKAGGDLLKGVRLFDAYTGDPIPQGHKSLAYNLTYQTDEKTLTDKEVARVHRKIVQAAERELGATLRA
jgi:phenylalanyl-tRNA synthetase beta chain